MESLLYYFLQVNVALAVLYCAYRLLFQRDTFFRMRRFTLLAVYLIAFLYPLPDLSHWLSTQMGMSGVVTYYSTLVPIELTQATDADTIETGWQASLSLWLTGLYAIGVFVLLLRCLVELTILVRTRQTSRRCTHDGYTYYQLYQPEEPYSFFGWIFIPPGIPADKASTAEILAHESAHVRGWHSLDVMLGEVVCILCWLNPFAWWLKQEISLNHEYIADEAVLYAGYDKKTYQYHLIGLEHPPLAAAKLYNNFSVLPLKKRITMLNKNRTHAVRRVKYLALLPLAIGLLLLNNMNATARILLEKLPVAVALASPEVGEAIVVANEPVADLSQQGDPVLEVVDVMPAFPGGEQELFKFLSTNVKYPTEAQQKGIQGRVILSYVVEKDGSLTQIKVVRGVDPLLDAESVRVISIMPKWVPGKDKGKVVRVKYTLPVVFRLQ